MPPKKKIKPGETHGYIGDKPKAKPKTKVPFVELEWLKQYRIERDRVLYKMFPNSREEIKNQHI